VDDSVGKMQESIAAKRKLTCVDCRLFTAQFDAEEFYPAAAAAGRRITRCDSASALLLDNAKLPFECRTNQIKDSRMIQACEQCAVHC
jgi:hypothetical protein